MSTQFRRSISAKLSSEVNKISAECEAYSEELVQHWGQAPNAEAIFIIAGVYADVARQLELIASTIREEG